LLDLAVNSPSRLDADCVACHHPDMKRRRKSNNSHAARRRVAEAVGWAISRLQDASYNFDDVAADILAVPRGDLPCLSMLWSAGPASADDLSAALQVPRGRIVTTLERAQLARYARFSADGVRIELTEHARNWVERIWGPAAEGWFPAARHISRPASDALRDISASGR
jgi:hypothetical protein